MRHEPTGAASKAISGLWTSSVAGSWSCLPDFLLRGLLHCAVTDCLVPVVRLTWSCNGLKVIGEQMVLSTNNGLFFSLFRSRGTSLAPMSMRRNGFQRLMLILEIVNFRQRGAADTFGELFCCT